MLRSSSWARKTQKHILLCSSTLVVHCFVTMLVGCLDYRALRWSDLWSWTLKSWLRTSSSVPSVGRSSKGQSLSASYFLLDNSLDPRLIWWATPTHAWRMQSVIFILVLFFALPVLWMLTNSLQHTLSQLQEESMHQCKNWEFFVLMLHHFKSILPRGEGGLRQLTCTRMPKSAWIRLMHSFVPPVLTPNNLLLRMLV